MKNTISFNPQDTFIFISAIVRGPLGEREIKLLLDTGASETFVTPEIMDVIGYSVRDAIERTSTSSIAGIEYGYRLRLKNFFAMGHEVENYAINVHDLSEDCEFDGLLGLSFLRNLNIEIRPKEGVILSELA